MTKPQPSNDAARESIPPTDVAGRTGTGAPSRRAVIIGAAAALGAAGAGSCTAAQPLPPFSGSSTSTPTTTTTSSGSHPSSQPSGPAPTRAAVRPATGAMVLASEGPDIRTGPPGGKLVALTFHGAGPVALAAAVLDIARAHSARITVFAVGQWLQSNSQIGKAILAGGHDLGNHTWSHQPMRRLTPAAAELEVRRGAEAVAAVRGTPGLLFRPSGTASSTATIRSAALASGYHRCISYDVDPRDYLDPGPAAVSERTLAAAHGGSIVSLHLGHAGTVAALPGILDGLRRQNLNPVTVTELLGATG